MLRTISGLAELTALSAGGGQQGQKYCDCEAGYIMHSDSYGLPRSTILAQLEAYAVTI